MPRAFDITSASPTATLTEGCGQAAFTVSSRLTRTVRARARVNPIAPARADWFELPGSSEYEFAPDQTHQLTVQIRVPPSAPRGRYQFSLEVAAVEQPDEQYTESPQVSFEITGAPPPPPAPFPWLLAAAGGLALLALLLAVFALVRGGPPGQQGPEGPSGPPGPTGSAIANIPPGTIWAFVGRTPPDGWLLCDGREVSRTDYAALFKAIGIAHGGGNGEDTFNLPDYRGRFLRGVDRGAGRDPDRATRGAMAPGGTTGDAVGSVQESETRSHGHGIADPGHAHRIADPGHSHVEATTNGTAGTRETAGAPAGGWDYVDSGGRGPEVSKSPTGISIQDGVTGVTVQASGGAETRPANANVLWIIKF